MNASPDHSDRLRVAPRTFIPTYELWFTFDRSSGPGGQNVNKRDSRVTLWFDAVSSPSLTARQKSLLQSRLSTRINRDGVLRMVASKFRTQAGNRRVLLERFVEVVTEALIEKTPRKKKKISKAAKRRRVEDKRHKSKIKQLRRAPSDE